MTDTKTTRVECQLQPVSLQGIATTSLSPPRFVVDKIIPRSVPTLAGGHGGVGKSQFGTALCAHSAAGQKWGPFDVVMAGSLFVSMEDRRDVVLYRLRRIIEGSGLDPEAIEANMTVLDGTEGDPLVGEAVIDGVRRVTYLPALAELAEAAKGKGLIVIDNASDAFAGNENDRAQVRGFMRALTGIARDNDAGLMLLAHIDKAAARFGSSGNTYSGSTAWHNSARSRLALVNNDGQLELVHEKSNFGPLADSVPLAWTEGGLLVPVDRAIEIHSPATDADDEAVMAAMVAASAADLIVPAAMSGPLTAWSVLRTLPECSVFDGRDGKRRLQRALTRLQRVSSITVDEYRNDHRHVRKRLVLRGCASAPVPLVPPSTGARFQRTAPVCAGSTTDAELTQLTQADDYRRGRDGE